MVTLLYYLILKEGKNEIFSLIILKVF